MRKPVQVGKLKVGRGEKQILMALFKFPRPLCCQNKNPFMIFFYPIYIWNSVVTVVKFHFETGEIQLIKYEQ